MSSVLVFAMWALVATGPCQDRASTTAPVVPAKQAHWAVPMTAIREEIIEESRRRGKKGSSSGASSPVSTGLLAEM
ncbi:unnamed protein product [Triticum turgidum subsp. durum]|uniref:Uncharacterized protein n=1 Tax=Triticum turgidum subsp. durum TaxID=4567 RepID=A0A9R1Q7N2_TRITD|nr:unnamed protein product [Triticum turgidum subsp. durum]